MTEKLTSEAAQRQLETLLEGCLEGNTLSIETALNAAYDLGAASADVRELREALQKMIGWAKYAEEFDPWYFSDEQAPTWRRELHAAEAALKKHGAGK